MAQGVYNLRSRRSFRVIERTLWKAAHRFQVRVVRFSVQGNHIHLLVEAPGQDPLTQAIKGLSVRIARGMNRMMGRKGRVIGDRYHARLLRTPTDVKRVISYLRENHRHHRAARGEHLPTGWVDPYSSDGPGWRGWLPAPATWLLRVGWQRGPG
jgi:REP element-mobilizing transposase RayT